MNRNEKTEEYLKNALDNIDEDRGNASYILHNLIQEMKSQGGASFKENGIVASKLLETLQRSNEQLVKIVQILDKKSVKEDEKLSQKDLDELDSQSNGE
ncbi:hypothetical protein M0R19_04415 [Candidatus Pacearchaeota archaeon]|jgi:hypothetical protein|nr:hypothetical protein [Candidatus Pacearchaeota archaeon]